MKKQYIGVFDSGLGGLTTVKQIIEKLPQENIVFLADTKHIPYGSKTREQIISYTLENIDILKRYDLKALVIACNTSDSNASDTARKVHDLKIFGVIAPAARKAVKTSENKKIGLLATTSTIASGRYEKQIHDLDEKAEVFPMACPDLVPMIEEGAFISDKKAMKEKLHEYIDPLIDKQIDTLILGCTHYDILTELINEIFPDLRLVSSSRCVIDDLKAFLEDDDDQSVEKTGERIYLASKDAESYDKVASLLIPDIRFQSI